jgi:hypothetical protein
VGVTTLIFNGYNISELFESLLPVKLKFAQGIYRGALVHYRVALFAMTVA